MERLPLPVATQYLLRGLGQQLAYPAPFPFDSGNIQAVVGRCLMPHPGNYRLGCSFFYRNAGGTGYRSTAHRDGV